MATEGVSFHDLSAGGQVGDLIRQKDWSATSLGALSSWPRSLKNHLSMIFELPTAAIIFWGPDQIQLYNDGYSVIMGPRHPKHLGSTFRECWPEAYDSIIPCGCSRWCWRTCWGTPGSSPRSSRPPASRSARMTARCSCGTTARDSTCNPRQSCSRRFSAFTPRPSSQGQGSGSPRCSASLLGMAGGSGPRRHRATVPRSSLRLASTHRFPRRDALDRLSVRDHGHAIHDHVLNANGR